MKFVYSKRYGLNMEKSEFCCDYLRKLSDDEDINFDFVTDNYYDLVKQEWITTSEPYPALCYKVPGYYGESSTEYLKINRCPFCGKLLTLDGGSQMMQTFEYLLLMRGTADYEIMLRIYDDNNV